MTDSPAAMASGAPAGAVPVPLSLPAADLAEVTADIANAPVVRWLRALTSWAGTGRGVAEFARVPPADRAEVSALLGFDDAPRKERGLLVDIAVRWAVEANLLRLRTGTLRPAKRHLPLLDDPAALWFRMLSALARPDMAFTDLLGEYSGYHYGGYSLGHDVAELTQAVAGAGALDEAQLAAWHGRWSPGPRRHRARAPLGARARAAGHLPRDPRQGGGRPVGSNRPGPGLRDIDTAAQ